ncbi:MAG: iron-sulfur cluster repair di-iron protein [Haliscomenobacter sp.]
MKVDILQTVGSVVAEDYRTAVVFKQYGIDFCCGGGRSLEETCRSKGIAVEEVQEKLESVQQLEKQPDRLDFADWSLVLLSTYIEEKHHRYVRQVLPGISEFALKVARVHGQRHPETVEIWTCWQALAEELSAHLRKEEQVLFPYVRLLESTNPPAAPFGSVANPIAMMTQEHESAGALMENIRVLSSHFSPPEDACVTYRVLYQLLAEFESDLHQHIHLENNLLFPKALAQQQQVFAAVQG